MFDIGGLELLLIAVVALLVIGPERLPEALRTLGLWIGRLRRSFTSVKAEIEKEIGMDEVRRQLHNEAVMDEMKRIEAEVKAAKTDVAGTMDIDPNAAIVAATNPLPESPSPPVEPSETPKPDSLESPVAQDATADAEPTPAAPAATPHPHKDEHDLEAEWIKKQDKKRTHER